MYFYLLTINSGLEKCPLKQTELEPGLSRNCKTLRFLVSEPLSVQFSLWYKGEMTLARDSQEELVPFNWVNSNIGGAVVDGEEDF